MGLRWRHSVLSDQRLVFALSALAGAVVAVLVLARLAASLLTRAVSEVSR